MATATLKKKKTEEELFLEKKHRETLKKQICARWQLYLLMVIPLGYLIVFNYVPMTMLVIAFKDYTYAGGIWGSEWVGFAQFTQFFESTYFLKLLRNTLTVSLYVLATFPIAVIFALLLNCLPSQRYKKLIQTVTYVPHFISMVVMIGIVFQVLNARTGLYGSIYMLLNNGESAPDILAVGTNFKHLYVWSGIWQNTGYAAIVYIAALAGVDSSLHEAALIDGATRWQRVLYIDLPSILPMASIMFILAAGGLMNLGYEKVLLMQNTLNLEYSEVISTYVYKVGLASGITDFSYSAAISMFNSIINLILLLITNTVSKKLSGNGLF